MLRPLLLCALLLACSLACSESSDDDEPSPASGGTTVVDVDAGAGGEAAGAGQGGTGGAIDPGPPPAGDTCDDAVDVNEVAETDTDGTLVVRGTYVAAHDDLSACETLSTPLADVVYRYTAPASGGLLWTLSNVTPTLFVVDIRTSCADGDSNLFCDECGNACGNALEVSAGDTFYFVIFGVRTTNSPDGTGSFELTLDLSPDPELGDLCVPPTESGRDCPEGSVCQGPLGEAPTCGERVCGDGLLTFELLECDDGNELSGDGCSADCLLDVQGPGSDSCEAPTELHLPTIRHTFGDGSSPYGGAQGTFVAGSDLDAGCSEAAGPEAVYVFELAEPSTVEMVAENVEVLSVRAAGATDCGSEELECQTGAAAEPLAITTELEAGRYAVILDREQPTDATTDGYALTLIVNPP